VFDAPRSPPLRINPVRLPVPADSQPAVRLRPRALAQAPAFASSAGRRARAGARAELLESGESTGSDEVQRSKDPVTHCYITAEWWHAA
jgi:hypothetical protein